jgi:hypothetical protein
LPHTVDRPRGTIRVPGVLRQPSFERGDPHFLLLDGGEQLDNRFAHDQRGPCPTGGIQRKPCWQWDIGHHCLPLMSSNGKCNQR